jgi:hypothetical protein
VSASVVIFADINHHCDGNIYYTIAKDHLNGKTRQGEIDLVEIWRYSKEQSSRVIADRIEAAIREKFAFLAQTPGAG